MKFYKYVNTCYQKLSLALKKGIHWRKKDGMKIDISFISQEYYVTNSIPFDVLYIFAYYVSSVHVGTFELPIDKYQRPANNDKACLVCHSNELRRICTHPDVETGVKSRDRSINVYTICIQWSVVTQGKLDIVRVICVNSLSSRAAGAL